MRWPTVPLKEIAPAQTPNIRFSPDEPVWHLTLDQVESHTGNIVNKKIAPASAAGTSTNVFDDGNVLYSKLRPYLNKVICPTEPGIATTELVPLRPRKDLLDRRYLTYYLRSNHFLGFANVAVAGVKMPRIIMTKFWKHRIPLPPLFEQHRIVEILDQADALRKKRADADAKAARILPAIFYKMFGDPANNKDQVFLTLADCAEIIMGQSPPGETYNRQGDGLPFFQGKLDFGPVNPIARQWCSQPSRIAEPGDILLCVRAPVGPTNIADIKCAIGRGLAIVRPISGKSTTEFLFYSLRAIEKEVAKIAQGSTFTAIRRQDVENIKIPKAGEKEQLVFSTRAKNIQGLLDKGTTVTTHIEKLFSVLLHRAFTADLTAKWREGHIKELLQEM